MMSSACTMSRYIKKYGRVGHALGPGEERGFAIWVGYDLAGLYGDLSDAGLINVDDWSDERLAGYGIETFARVEPDDETMHEKLGIGAQRGEGA